MNLPRVSALLVLESRFQVGDAVADLFLETEARLLEHLHDGGVLAQDVRGEAEQALPARDLAHVRQQLRADASALELVPDRQRYLGGVAVAHDHVPVSYTH